MDIFSLVKLDLVSFSIIATTIKIPESDQNTPGLFTTSLDIPRKAEYLQVVFARNEAGSRAFLCGLVLWPRVK